MLRSSTRTIQFIGLSLVAGTAVGCGDDDDAVRDRDGSADASDDGGNARGDAGRDKDGGMDGGTRGDASMPPGAFMIRGVTGSGDEVADGWLLNGTSPELEWTASDGVQRYEATILEEEYYDGEWTDTSLVANDVQIKFKLALTGIAPL